MGQKGRTHWLLRCCLLAVVSVVTTRACNTTVAHFTNHSPVICEPRSPMVGASEDRMGLKNFPGKR